MSQAAPRCLCICASIAAYHVKELFFDYLLFCLCHVLLLCAAGAMLPWLRRSQSRILSAQAGCACVEPVRWIVMLELQQGRHGVAHPAMASNPPPHVWWRA